MYLIITIFLKTDCLRKNKTIVGNEHFPSNYQKKIQTLLKQKIQPFQKVGYFLTELNRE